MAGVLLNDGSPPWNVAGAGSIRSTSGGLQLLSGVLLKDDSPSLNVACVGSVRSTTWGCASVVRCPLERLEASCQLQGVVQLFLGVFSKKVIHAWTGAHDLKVSGQF